METKNHLVSESPQKPHQITLKVYLSNAQRHVAFPNFYMSDAYLSIFKDIKYYELNGWYWCEDDKWILFPPFNEDIEFSNFSLHKPVWVDYDHCECSFENQKETVFFDHEYLFKPKDFLNMEGGRWETFRKNSRKWLKANNNKYKYISNYKDEQAIINLLLNWLVEKEVEREDSIQDEMVFYELILLSNKVSRKFLVNSENKLIGINVFDRNWEYWNYRICITNKDEKYANEFLRLLFYTDPIILNSEMLVNDGGTLECPSLEKFKDKMNPLLKDKRQSILI